MNLFLIGYRCTGKTTVGKLLAARLSRRFVDADAEVVADVGMTIAELVAQQGWPAFRQAERTVMERLCQQDHLVVATGGGVVLDEKNIQNMRRAGQVVWLKASPETILSRMKADAASLDQRPALTDHDLAAEIRETLAQRGDLYSAAADAAFDADTAGIKTLADLILEWTADPVMGRQALFPGVRDCVP